jgi:hypothetical protein
MLSEYSLHSADTLTDYKYSFLLQGKKSFLLRAENQIDKDDWMEVLLLLVTILNFILILNFYSV